MGKIVKFCSSCDEGFAEKFGFCPNCGQSLQTFEMSPVVPEAGPVAPVAETTAPDVEPVPEVIAAPVVTEVAEPVEAFVEAEVEVKPEVEAAPLAETEPAAEIVEPFEAAAAEEAVIEEPVIEEPVVTEPIAAAPAAKAVASTNIYVPTPAVNVDRAPVSLEAEHNAYISKGEFYVTVIEEKNAGTRNALLLGTLGLMIFSLMTALVVNLFSKDLEVGSINDDIFNAVIVDIDPMNLEEQEQRKKEKDAGGGGGGGRDEDEETTQGDLADQSKNPTRPPDAKVYRSDNFELKMPPPQTEGDRTFEKKFDRWGDPNGRFASFSNGTGTGGGQGSGTGTGQGSGRGTGAGSGDGSGSGSGLGNGNGDGTGDGPGGNIGAPPPRPVGVTQGLKIISKPRPGYTDAARQNNIQGTVVLRVTFLASGQIGSISPVKGLPNGLTEMAIAAARRIAFEPAKRDGQGQTVIRPVEYTFSIY